MPSISFAACAGPAEGDEQRGEGDDHRQRRAAACGGHAGARARTIGAHRRDSGHTRRTFERRRSAPAGLVSGGAAPHGTPRLGGRRRRCSVTAQARRGRDHRQPVGPVGGAARGRGAGDPGRVRGERRLLRADRSRWRCASRPTARCSSPRSEGIVKRFSGLGDATPETVADVRAATHDYWDRGLIGLAVDPGYPAAALHLRLLHLGPPGAAGPTTARRRRARRTRAASSTAGSRGSTSTTRRSRSCWPARGASSSRATASAGSPSGRTARCTRAPATAPASTTPTSGPTSGRPGNPCGDPAREGGSIRSQDLRTAGDPAGPRRLDPAPEPGHGRGRRAATRSAASAGSQRAADHRPGPAQPVPDRDPARARTSSGRRTSAGTCGRRSTATPRPGPARTATSAGRATRARRASGSWDQLGQPGLRGPLRRERRAGRTRRRTTPTATPTRWWRTRAARPGTSSISGLEFYDGGTFPAEYDGALFFADYARSCAWAMLRGANGLPDPARIRTFITGAPVVDLQVGPGGALFFVDIDGTVRRIRALAGNRAPTARATATPGARARAARGHARRPRLDRSRRRHARLRLGPRRGRRVRRRHRRPPRTAPTRRRPRSACACATRAAWRTSPRSASSPASRPRAAIAAPAAGTTWKVGDRIAFSGSGTSGTGAPLPASALSWELRLHHCPIAGCHVHPDPDLGRDRVRDGRRRPTTSTRPTSSCGSRRPSGGLTTSVSRRLDPRTVALTVATDPPGLQAFLGSASGPAPLGADVIVGSTHVARRGGDAASSSGARGRSRAGRSRAPAARDVVAGDTAATYTAHFATGPDPRRRRRPAAAAPRRRRARRPQPRPCRAPAARRAPLRPRPARRRARRSTAPGDSATAPGARPVVRASRSRPGCAPRAASGATPCSSPSAAAAPRPRSAGAAGRTAWRKGLRVDAGLRNGRWSHVALTWDGESRASTSTAGRAGRRARAPRLGRVTRLRLGGDPAPRRVAARAASPAPRSTAARWARRPSRRSPDARPAPAPRRA